MEYLPLIFSFIYAHTRSHTFVQCTGVARCMCISNVHMCVCACIPFGALSSVRLSSSVMVLDSVLLAVVVVFVIVLLFSVSFFALVLCRCRSFNVVFIFNRLVYVVVVVAFLCFFFPSSFSLLSVLFSLLVGLMQCILLFRDFSRLLLNQSHGLFSVHLMAFKSHTQRRKVLISWNVPSICSEFKQKKMQIF